MSEKLCEVRETEVLKSNDFPAGVLGSAIRFLSSALEGAGDGPPKNGVPDITNYIYACDALGVRVCPVSSEEIRTKLQKFLDFLKFIKSAPHYYFCVGDEDHKLIILMILFFSNSEMIAAQSQTDEFYSDTDDDE